MIKKALINLLIIITYAIATPTTNYIYSQNKDTLSVYVWNFTFSDPSFEEFSKFFTNDFETVLLELGKHSVLERIRYDRVILHKDLENQISDIKNVPISSLDSLKVKKADAVFFGDLNFDEGSGEFEVSVKLQSLNKGENILRKASIVFKKGIIDDNSSRKRVVEDLIKELYKKEIMTSKKEQFAFVSKLLKSYLASIKDIHIAFEGIADFALQDKQYFNELEQIIANYNKIWRDLNGNRDKYLKDFEDSWGEPYSKEFGNIYSEMMDNIHETEILPLNEIRKDIWRYHESELNKREKEKIKRKIDEDVIRMTKNLQEEYIEVKNQINSFLSDIR